MRKASFSHAVVLSVTVLMVSGMAAVSAPAAASTFVVQVGSTANQVYEYTRYYPESVDVHAGDTVEWHFQGFHSVSFFGTHGRPDFLRLDDGITEYAATEYWADNIGPNETACGRGTDPACDLQSQDTFISSGAPVADKSPFRVTFNMPAGEYSYFCNIHPSMKGTVRVVDQNTPVADQQQIDSAAAQALAADTAAADALVRHYNDPAHLDRAADGAPIVHVGASTPDNHVAVLLYLPTRVTVPAGGRVSYVYGVAPTPDEVHTVTFPADLVGPDVGLGGTPVPQGLSSSSFFPECDLDGEEGPAPGVIATTCPNLLEVGASSWVTSPTHSPTGVSTPATFENSAMLLPEATVPQFRNKPGTNGAEHWPSSFDATFPSAGEFGYACIIHGTRMSGVVSVA